MPVYSLVIKVFSTEDEMAWNNNSAPDAYTTPDEAAEAAITYFKQGGEGPLAGLVESNPRGTEDNGDYVCRVASVSAPA
jgi:hypothetical protein